MKRFMCIIVLIVLLSASAFGQVARPGTTPRWDRMVAWILNGQETLTYKTLTSPTITGATITTASYITFSNGLRIDNTTNNAFTWLENSENLKWTFGTNAITVSSDSGVTSVDFGAINLATDELDLSEGNITNAGEIAADLLDADGSGLQVGDGDETVYIYSSDWAISTTGALTAIAGVTFDNGLYIHNVTNNKFTWLENGENLVWTFATDAITVASDSGVASIDFGTINLATDALDLSDGNIANVGNVALDSIHADGSAIVLGKSTATTTINTSDWGISATGAVTGVNSVVFDYALKIDNLTNNAFTWLENDENLKWTFGTNSITVSSDSGVTEVDFGTLNLGTDALDLSEGHILNVGNIEADTLKADATTIVLDEVAKIIFSNGLEETNPANILNWLENGENLKWTFSTNNVAVSSDSGVTQVDFGTLNLKTDLYTFNNGLEMTNPANVFNWLENSENLKFTFATNEITASSDSAAQLTFNMATEFEAVITEANAITLFADAFGSGKDADTLTVSGGTSTDVYSFTWTSDPGDPVVVWVTARTGDVIITCDSAVSGTPSYTLLRRKKD